MSDNIVRTSVVDEDNSLIKKQVMNKTDDHLIRHQVLGLGGEPTPQPTYDTLNATANGTYYPGEGVDAFDEVIVEVPSVIPEQELVSHFDFVNEPNYKDLARNYDIGSLSHGNIDIVPSTGLVSSNSGSWCRTLFSINPAETYRIEIEFGEFTPDESITTGNKAIINYGNNGNTDNVFGYDFSKGKFSFKTGSGTINTDTLPSNYLSNKKLIIYCSCNLINGALTKTYNNQLYFYVGNEYLGYGHQTATGYTTQLGFFRSSDAFYNAVIKNCKIYKINNAAEPQ